MQFLVKLQGWATKPHISWKIHSLRISAVASTRGIVPKMGRAPRKRLRIRGARTGSAGAPAPKLE